MCLNSHSDPDFILGKSQAHRSRPGLRTEGIWYSLLIAVFGWGSFRQSQVELAEGKKGSGGAISAQLTLKKSWAIKDGRAASSPAPISVSGLVVVVVVAGPFSKMGEMLDQTPGTSSDVLTQLCGFNLVAIISSLAEVSAAYKALRGSFTMALGMDSQHIRLRNRSISHLSDISVGGIRT